MELNLLNKTELFINNIQLNNVNLGSVANSVAKVLRLKPSEVAVVDVREGLLTLDILRPHVDLEDVVGKEKEILEALQALPGISINNETAIHSEGVLGMISLANEVNPEVFRRTEEITKQVKLSVSKRILVFPTGSELIKNYIEDTNTPYLRQKLSEMNYEVSAGPILEDNLITIVSALRNAVSEGFGVVITTGGVGAEDKDHTVEAITVLDKQAATPYLVHYHKGQGRHKKDGVRIAVGQLEWTTFVALPGPHDEVQMALPTLIEGLREKWDKQKLAGALADVLRSKWATKHKCTKFE